MTDTDPTVRPSEDTARVIALVPWERSLRRGKSADAAFDSSARQRPQDLLESARRIAQATPLESFYAVKRRGLADALPALGALSTPQIRTLLDLEAWRSDTLEIPDLLSWLEGFRVAGHAALVRASRALDPEALAALFRRRLHIALAPREDRSEEDEPLPEWLRNPDPSLEIMQTPDGRFLIAPRVADERVEMEADKYEEADEEEQKQVVALVRELYLDEDWEYVASVLRQALTDLTSNLEEEAYGLRTGRVEDLGFPSRERALELFAPLPVSVLEGDSEASPVSVGDEDRMPLVHASVLSQGLLETALRGLPGPRAARVEADLLALANGAMVLEGTDPADLDGVAQTLTRLRGWVELGLAFGRPAEAEGASARLAVHHPTELARVGRGLVLQVRRRAHALVGHVGWDGHGLDALSGVERAVVEALLAPQPALSGALEPWRDDRTAAWLPEAAEARRELADPASLGAAEAALDRLEALARASATLGLFDVDLDPDRVWPEDPADLDLDHRLATLGAQAALGRSPAVVPLGTDACLDLVDLVGTAEVSGRWPKIEPLVEQVSAGLEGAEAAAMRPRLEAVMHRLSETLFPLVGRVEVDPRFLEGLIRAR